MKQYLKTVVIATAAALLGAGAVAWAARTNYLGTVFIADTTTPANQLKVGANGSLDINVISGGGTGGTASNFDAAFPAQGTAIGLSDGTNMKSWLAAVILGDGVNGNNTGAVAPWLWNGATYDRARGDTTAGAWVQVKAAIPAGSNTIGAVNLAGQSFTNITTNTDTNVKASAGTFAGITVNTGGTTSTAKIYNDGDGTCNSNLIATVDTTSRVSLTYNVAAGTGICVTTAGAGAADITITWR